MHTSTPCPHRGYPPSSPVIINTTTRRAPCLADILAEVTNPTSAHTPGAPVPTLPLIFTALLPPLLAVTPSPSESFRTTAVARDSDCGPYGRYPLSRMVFPLLPPCCRQPLSLLLSLPSSPRLPPSPTTAVDAAKLPVARDTTPKPALNVLVLLHSTHRAT
ncbi:hypothetical protein MHU86_13077 [Fragilaria crotonensis]|nr:hypothetical protein MHU86_13077 [Fragilaria crotonensis]